MAGFAKLRRSEVQPGEGPDRAVVSALSFPVSKKRTLAVAQKYGKVG
jgi:hypothetical protein